jgi:hypothetical protein
VLSRKLNKIKIHYMHPRLSKEGICYTLGMVKGVLMKPSGRAVPRVADARGKLITAPPPLQIKYKKKESNQREKFNQSS